MSYRYLFVHIALLTLLYGCGTFEKEPPLFHKLSPDETGVTFSNTVTPNDSLNYLTDFLIYNGAGVAVGDINNDGLPDIYLTGNMVSSQLYLNRGNMRFENITEQAGVVTTQRATGASMVDINGDGYLDIYVSISGPDWAESEELANLLFVNNGDSTFTEAAADYAIDDTGFTTHGVFFDYNRDGFLDLFVLNNSPGEFARGETGRNSAGSASPDPRGLDQLYRNNGDGSFTNVSEEAGILKDVGYGLGVVVSDLDRDGWPDLYVSNDITPNDVLYINNKDGTFTNKASEWLRHTSYSGMGIDIADFNNDGWPDIIQTDMVPGDLSERKRMTGHITYEGFMSLRQRGFFPHYDQNSLQLNLGITEDGDLALSEIARMAGVAYTNWSWSALFADYNNDGSKDIFITNGYPKAIIDFDFQTTMHQARETEGKDNFQQKIREILDNVHSYRVPNYIFRNEGGQESGHSLTFTDKSTEWGIDHPGFSYGAAYADLNNDGRLDLVVNNLDEPAYIYENTGLENDGNHWLQVRLEGELPNKQGLGSKLVLTAGGEQQHIYHTPYRGYMSTVDDKIHFGLGKANRVDSLKVIWPDGRIQLLKNLETDQMIIIDQKDSVEQTSVAADIQPENKRFRPMDNAGGLNYVHRQKQDFSDYNIQPLLPYEVSRQGPPLAAGDVTGDGLDDIFIGGSAGFAGKLFIQQGDGSFVESSRSQPWTADRDYEDWGAVFFDANKDGHMDLYVASGGYQVSPASDLLQDRLYINQGEGRFLKDRQALPKMLTSTAGIAVGDFTGDGMDDLFVGGRLKPRNYPYPTRSYLLRNDGGRFTDITPEAAPYLVDPGGMITDAVWMDFNDDQLPDLVTAGVWMPLRFYENDGEGLHDVTREMGLPSMRGWWYSLEKGDFNSDGHTDLIAGNLGLNHSYTTSKDSLFGVYAGNLSGSRTAREIIFTKEVSGTEYPYYGLAKLGREIYQIGLKFDTHESFSKASVRQIFDTDRLNEALHYQADTFASVHMQNNGDGTFTSLELPRMGQISPIQEMIADDIDKDGNLDLILAGNIYRTEPNIARADAGNGLWLKGDGKGNFNPVPPSKSGFLAPLDAKDMVVVNTPDGKAVVIANNSDSLQVYVIGN